MGNGVSGKAGRGSLGGIRVPLVGDGGGEGSSEVREEDLEEISLDHNAKNNSFDFDIENQNK